MQGFSGDEKWDYLLTAYKRELQKSEQVRISDEPAYKAFVESIVTDDQYYKIAYVKILFFMFYCFVLFFILF